MNGWTPERRARQAAAIRRRKPWEQSTGPRSEAGKVRSSRNADKGGQWRKLRELSRAVNALLRRERERLAEVRTIANTDKPPR
ncbi:hypothetical protein GCM10023089_07080 [Quisquiliibacterium transsilvanicum]